MTESAKHKLDAFEKQDTISSFLHAKAASHSKTQEFYEAIDSNYFVRALKKFIASVALENTLISSSCILLESAKNVDEKKKSNFFESRPGDIVCLIAFDLVADKHW